eukprot:7688409-Ditylum_brightwellii.AAC.1
MSGMRVSRINRSGGQGPTILHKVLCTIAGFILLKNVYIVPRKVVFVCHCTLLRMLRFSDAIAPGNVLSS